MAAEVGTRVDVANLLSLGDDLVGVLHNRKDADAFAQVCVGSRMLRSACYSDSGDLELQLKEYQEKINVCKEKADRTKGETIGDAELNALQNEMEERLQDEQQLRQELRVVHDELNNLDRQRTSIEERKDAVKKKEKDMLKAQNMLSMCVSVTNVMPNFEVQEKVSGCIVDKNKKKGEKFEFEKTASTVEI